MLSAAAAGPAPATTSAATAMAMAREILTSFSGSLTRIEKIDDRFDFPVGQNQIAPERRHHGLRVALGLVEHDSPQFLAVGKPGFHVGKRRPDIAGRVTALDIVAGQAIALAAVERQRLARQRLRRCTRAGEQHDGKHRCDKKRRAVSGSASHTVFSAMAAQRAMSAAYCQAWGIYAWRRDCRSANAAAVRWPAAGDSCH